MAKMSRGERAKEYLQRLKRNPTDLEARQIVVDLNLLVFAESGEPLSKEEKLAIVNEMLKQASSGLILEHADNQEILSLINLVNQIIEGGGKK